ncbi:Major Facilitator Superfamily [Actinomyces bovis]|uniref:Major Facilitator Superfamily n=1 Tax=Actinomyces bovis TaxID=1658 RepID=A0ABY1VLS8_9ACTO|nr:MFS transporter [Actinomyces bovis]SPT53059.1 Major Facilitator Superfamily [Actinomyces bovis]VEG53004.1 Major Facilitator Superfamily [Actinomyces israelii]
MPSRQAPRSQQTLRALLAMCLFTYVAQNMLNVSIAPLARALQLREWVVGLAVSAAAVTVALLSQFWGRRSVSWGRRRVLLLALSLALVAGSLFASAVWLRAAGQLGGLATAVAVVVARGPLFGSGVAAIPPTGQALIAEMTPDETARVRGMSAFSGAVQLSIVVGSVVSSLLGSWSIYAPVYATPGFLIIALLIGLVWIPRDSSEPLPVENADGAPAAALNSADKHRSALPPRVAWTDRRVLPWIGAAFGMFFTLGVVQIIAGFIVQDRLSLSAQQAVPLTAVMLLSNAVGAMLTQLVLVPRLVWSPRRLVRAGGLVTLVALSVLALASQLWLMAAATFAIGLGGGLVGPGFTAGGSLAVRPEEQGGVAGVLHASGAVTWIFAPVLATALYGWWPLAPFVLALAVLSLSVLVAWTSRALSNPRRPATNLR